MVRQLGQYLGSVPVISPLHRQVSRIAKKTIVQPLRSSWSSDRPLQSQSVPNKQQTVSDTANQDRMLEQKIQQEQARHPNDHIVVEKKDDKHLVPKTAQAVSPILLKIKSVFPFELFPDELIIEENRIVINKRFFFWTNVVDTIHITDIKVFEACNTILFSTVVIKGDKLGGLEYEIKWLWPKEAMKAKEIVDGLYMKEKVDLQVPEGEPEKVSEVIAEIGKADVTR